MTEILLLVAGLWIGFVLGYFGHKIIIKNRSADGKCIQLADGEMYLKISEEAQRKLVDPKTELLLITVEHPNWKNLPTRKEQSL